MIISASRRTDIPAHFTDWLLNRIREGYVLVRNPMNPLRISRISMDPEIVDGIVFWTKNPIPLIDKLDRIPYPYYFQFTLNPYGTDIEPGVPSKSSMLIPAFIRLSDKIGPDNIIWRYDPIILCNSISEEYHLRYFEQMARRLSGHVKKCTFSFLDIYRNTPKNMSGLGIREIGAGEMVYIAKNMSQIASAYGITLSTCCEEIDLTSFGIEKARCIDSRIFERLTGTRYEHAHDKNQRPGCGCDASIDIGAYHCCINGCLYCYANLNRANASKNFAQHDPYSPLLIGGITDSDTISDRAHSSVKIMQQRMDI